ncbi:NfeD family protein [Nocardioides sp. HDW12B]|uniref:NfeD family protein n=1 Tax=Nocardioides sp. HDW12B TaxID=2714939 RepID=UPI00140DD55A|nr:NfeD family protein [Nocardioides sp. HDW12B]QIK66378.1 NfeD family protein [Nocardioides sp. HDW12B]
MDWDWVRENAWAAWLVAAMVLGGAEMLSLDLVLLMLAVGALGGMTADLVGLGLGVQVVVALVTSVGLLALVRPGVVKKLHHGPDLVQGHDALIGMEGFAVAEITEQSGQAKIRGEVWTVRPYDPHEVIASGAKVQVLEIRGATAYVHEIPQLGS